MDAIRFNGLIIALNTVKRISDWLGDAGFTPGGELYAEKEEGRRYKHILVKRTQFISQCLCVSLSLVHSLSASLCLSLPLSASLCLSLSLSVSLSPSLCSLCVPNVQPKGLDLLGRKGTAADKAVADKKRESRANLALVSIATTRSLMSLFVVVSFLWTSHEVNSK